MRRGRPPYDDVLTPRQWQVVAMLQEGLTNEQIAARLGITADGAKYHVAEILSKLGVGSREEAARVVPQRRQPVLVPWLPELLRRPSPITSSVLAVILVVLVALLTRGLPGSKGDSPPPSPSQAGLDTATATLPNTLLPTKGAPANVSTYGAALSTLRQVSTADELRAALSPEIRLVVVDRSALEEARTSVVLHGEVTRGRSVLGLNVTNSELRDVTDFMLSPAGMPSQSEIRAPSSRDAFYSYLIYGAQADVVILGGFQRYFFERVFETDLARMNAGQIPDTSGPPVPVSQLPEERISVNRGMGCTFDDRKTAAVTKSEVAALKPDVEVLGLMIAYCNPGPPGQVVIGVVLPTPEGLVRITVPMAELMP